jgi:hypothetical protein
MSILDLKGISFKVIIIGESSNPLITLGVGKTTLIHKYIHGEFLNEYNITVGVDFKSKTVQLKDRFVQLQIWDTVSFSFTFSAARNSTKVSSLASTEGPVQSFSFIRSTVARALRILNSGIRVSTNRAVQLPLSF